MNISEECVEKLKEWVAVDTWHTNHDLDMDRFYKFIQAYHLENGCHISDESILAETIANYAGIDSSSPLFDTLSDCVSLLYSILDYLKVTA